MARFKKPLPTQTELQELFEYDPLTGIVIWKPKANPKTGWNRRHAGKVAGGVTKFGYIVIWIGEEKFFAHRLVWALIHGDEPEDEIDHIDGDRSNNRIENLRAVSIGENRRNQRLSTRNTSGVTGVGWHKASNKFRAHINVDGKYKELGRFDTFDEAVAVRKSAEREHGYHPNHGREAA